MASGPMRKNGGFTLTEMVAVMAIVLLLGALLIPSFGHLSRQVERVSCTNNLRQFGATTALQHASTPGAPSLLTVPEQWAAAVLEEMDDARSLLRCPADPNGELTITTTVEGGTATGISKEEFGNHYRLRIQTMATYTGILAAGEPEYKYLRPEWNAWTNQLGEAQRDAQNASPYTFMKDLCGVYRASHCRIGNYDADPGGNRYWLYSDCTFSIVKGHSWQYFHPVDPYTGKEMNLWIIRHPTAGYMMADYGCPVYRITHNADNTIEILTRGAAQRFSGTFRPTFVKREATPTEDGMIVDWGPDAMWTLTPPGATANVTPVLGAFEEAWPKVTIGEGEGEPDTVVEETVISYGVNQHVTDAAGLGPDKILVADYDHLVISEDDVWDPAPAFARHGGYVNVLFRGGGVTRMLPELIDPSVVSNAQRYLLP